MIGIETHQSTEPARDRPPDGRPPRLGGPAKILTRHQERLAVVYVRQSSPQQVLEHRESTALQYNLRRLAIDWGWPTERVLVIDQDLGRSGTTVEGRLGFQRLLAEVSLDHVGLVLGMEMSRLARSCRDWHQLLELCAVFGTLLADSDGLYDPGDYNDRLLLGLKGTLSEAELHLLQQRMQQGRLNKARRGELYSHAPVGYMRSPTGGLQIEPDEQAQAAVRLVFDKFDELGTINAVLQYLARHQFRLGFRAYKGPDRGSLQWRPPSRNALRRMLRHPVYAGVYTWGRCQVDRRRRVSGRPARGRMVASLDECPVVLHHRCPVYITWARYEANQERLRQNRARAGSTGAPRDGPSLLAGLVVCGHCGTRMTVIYPGGAKRVRYGCYREHQRHGGPGCQNLSGSAIEEWVSGLVLRALEPASVELSLRAGEDVERERERLVKHWDRHLERARFEADRAARQYQTVEPENRLVARELERRWEAALLEQRKVEEARDRFLQELPPRLKDCDRETIRALASDIPSLWRSPATLPSERKTVVRCLIERVVVTARRAAETIDLAVHWAGGFVSHSALPRPVWQYQQLPDFPRIMARILELRGEGLTTARIAAQLNHEGWRPLASTPAFNAYLVRQLLCRHGGVARQSSGRPPHGLADNEWWLGDLARELGVVPNTLNHWARRGWVHGRQLPGPLGRWILWADTEECDRLRRLNTCPRTWRHQRRNPDLTRPKLRPYGEL